MKVIVVCAFVVACVASAMVQVVVAEPRIYPDQVAEYTFERYVREFGRTYEAGSEEYNARSKLFHARIEAMIAHNADPSNTWTRTINRFTDRTEAERKAVRGARLHFGDAPSTRQEYVPAPRAADFQLPDSVDWRTKGVITGVKDQGQCGSCWAHASTESIESYVALATGQLPVLSQMQIASCTDNPHDCGGSGGCEGGIAELAFHSVATRGGIASVWTYPYTSYWGTDSPCKYDPKTGGTPNAASVGGYVKLPQNNYTAIMEALVTTGPLAITVDASIWHEYSSGVFTGCPQQTTLDHNVQLVGYGTDPTGGPYWLIRNSWGTSFGEDGYLRIVRHTENSPCGIDKNPADGSGCNNGPPQVTVCGSCGILYDVSYPTGASVPN